MDLQRTTEIITGIAQEAGALALEGFGAAESTHKHDGSLVTQYDSASEALIRARLAVHYPGHTVFGEEMGFEGPEDNEWIWYLDPIDGTSNYFFGLPMWGVSIGLAHRACPVAGVFHMPVTRQTWWAWRGGGAWCNGRAVRLYAPDQMNRSDLVCVSSTLTERYDLLFTQKIRALGCAAQTLATMASGAYAGVVHDHWHLHDLAAGILMCAEAGAVITDLQGAPFTEFAGVAPQDKAPALVIAGAAIHATLLNSVKPKA